jgi:hypothetical protein
MTLRDPRLLGTQLREFLGAFPIRPFRPCKTVPCGTGGRKAEPKQSRFKMTNNKEESSEG